MHHAGDHFLSGSAFTPDENRGSRVGHLLDGHFHLFHLCAAAVKHGKVAVPSHLFAKLSHLGYKPLLIEDLGDAYIEFLRLKRLADVIVRAHF